MTAPSLPLTGITVLSIEQAVAAPFTTRQLADLGARVLKIERSDGDFARGYDRSVDGLSSYFVWLNRGKESVVLDLKSPLARRFFERVLPETDVLVQNLAPGAASRLGLGPSLLDKHPRLISASISGYGSAGPFATRKAYDLLVQCEAGLLSVTGTPETPSKAGISIADIAAGMYAYTGVLAALFERERTGRGQAFEVSMLEALAEWMSQPYYISRAGDALVRSGASHPSIAPYGPVPVRDGTVFIGIQNDREWREFCVAVLDDVSLATDARYATNIARVAARSALDALIASVTIRWTSEELEAVLDRVPIANARLRGVADLGTHPQLAARARWRPVDTPAGPVPAMLPPVTVAGREAAMGRVPALGASTQTVLAEFGLALEP